MSRSVKMSQSAILSLPRLSTSKFDAVAMKHVSRQYSMNHEMQMLIESDSVKSSLYDCQTRFSPEKMN